MARSAGKAKSNHRFRPISRAEKPGSAAAHWAKHPEEVDAALAAHGIDLEELDRVLEKGEGRLPVGDLAYPPPLRKGAKARSREAHTTR